MTGGEKLLRVTALLGLLWEECDRRGWGSAEGLSWVG